MTINRALRLMAGLVVLISVLLTQLVSAHFIWLTVIVGANLFQSAFTDWCPAMTVFRLMGLKN